MTQTAPQMIDTRDALKRAFLHQHGMGDAVIFPIPGDASFRRYDRLSHQNTPYILMDAPPPQEDIRPFCTVARFLLQHGFSAPQIIAEDATHGFLLLEDLGDDKFNTLSAAHPQHQASYYRAAMDALLALRSIPVPPNMVPPYDAALLLREVMLLPDWYYPHVHGAPIVPAARQAFEGIWQGLLAEIADRREVLVLRDYHADNLLWLPARVGAARVGQLDFQDAVHGAAAYDVVSLLEDARRDVPHAIQAEMLHYYIQQSGVDGAQFRHDYALLGAQRNSKILGIFARLIHRDAKPHYATYLPRVWAYLQQDIAALPTLAPLAAWLKENGLWH